MVEIEKIDEQLKRSCEKMDGIFALGGHCILKSKTKKYDIYCTTSLYKEDASTCHIKITPKVSVENDDINIEVNDANILTTFKSYNEFIINGKNGYIIIQKDEGTKIKIDA